MASPSSQETPEKYFTGQRLLILLLAAILINFLATRPPYRGVEDRVTFYLLKNFTDRKEDRDDSIGIAAILPEDWEDPALFGGCVPLRPVLVKNLFEAILSDGPSVMYADLLLGPPSRFDAELAEEQADLYRFLLKVNRELQETTIILALDSSECAPEPIGLNGYERTVADTLWDSLLFQSPVEGRVRFGFAEFTTVLGRVFALPRAIESTHGKSRTMLAAFEDVIGRQSLERELYFRFSRKYGDQCFPNYKNTISSGEILRAWHGSGQLGKFTDRSTVLIGGLYPQGRDYHETPLGRMAGVQIHAEAIAAVLSNRTLRNLGFWLNSLLDFLIGCVTGWTMFIVMRFGKSFAWGQVGGAVAGISGGLSSALILFHLGFIAAGFIWMPFAILAEQWVEDLISDLRGNHS